VEVQSSWGEALATIDFNTLSAATSSVPPAEDLITCGKLEKYNNTYNKISVRHEKKPRKKLGGRSEILQCIYFR